MGGKSAKRLAKRGWQPMEEAGHIRDGAGNVRPIPDGERWFRNDLYSACLRRQVPTVECSECDGDGMMLVHSFDGSVEEAEPCEACGGSGRADVIDDDRPARLHISYHRHDRKPARDWRHTQSIKNDIVGPEAEMVEMYPAESRLVDTANEYHLWGLEGVPLLAFGFNDGRIVSDTLTDEHPGAQQRPFHHSVATTTQDV